MARLWRDEGKYGGEKCVINFYLLQRHPQLVIDLSGSNEFPVRSGIKRHTQHTDKSEQTKSECGWGYKLV